MVSRREQYPSFSFKYWKTGECNSPPARLCGPQFLHLLSRVRQQEVDQLQGVGGAKSPRSGLLAQLAQLVSLLTCTFSPDLEASGA